MYPMTFFVFQGRGAVRAQRFCWRPHAGGRALSDRPALRPGRPGVRLGQQGQQLRQAHQAQERQAQLQNSGRGAQRVWIKKPILH